MPISLSIAGGAARAAEHHDRLVVAADGVADDPPRVLAQPGGLQAGAARLGVGVGVGRQHLVADEVLDEAQAAARRGVVGVRHPARAVGALHDLVVTDDGRRGCARGGRQTRSGCGVTARAYAGARLPCHLLSPRRAPSIAAATRSGLSLKIPSTPASRNARASAARSPGALGSVPMPEVRRHELVLPAQRSRRARSGRRRGRRRPRRSAPWWRRRCAGRTAVLVGADAVGVGRDPGQAGRGEQVGVGARVAGGGEVVRACRWRRRAARAARRPWCRGHAGWRSRRTG